MSLSKDSTTLNSLRQATEGNEGPFLSKILARNKNVEGEVFTLGDLIVMIRSNEKTLEPNTPVDCFLEAARGLHWSLCHVEFSETIIFLNKKHVWINNYVTEWRKRDFCI